MIDSMKKVKLFGKARAFSCPGEYHLPSRPANRGRVGLVSVTGAAGAETEGQQEIVLELDHEEKH